MLRSWWLVIIFGFACTSRAHASQLSYRPKRLGHKRANSAIGHKRHLGPNQQALVDANEAEGVLMLRKARKNGIAADVAAMYVINLDSRQDRWEQANSTLRPLGVPLHRWAAVKPPEGIEVTAGLYGDISRNPGKSVDWRRSLYAPNYYAVLGCYFSHLSVLQHIEDNLQPGKHYLVLEDDAFLAPGHLLQDLSSAIAAVDDPAWDAIRLDCKDSTGKLRFPSVLRTNEPQNWKETPAHKKYPYGGTHAILYRAESIPKVVRYLQEDAWGPLDAIFWTPKLNAYCVNHGHVKLNDLSLQSDIPKTADAGHKDKVSLTQIGHKARQHA